MRKLTAIALTLFVPLLTAVAIAGNPATRPQPWDIEVRAVTKQLESGDAAEVTSAVALMKERIKPLPEGFPTALGAARSEFTKAFMGRWGTRLVQLKRCDEVEQIAVACIIINQGDANTAAMMERLRTQAFGAAGKEEAALAAAKGYYNVCGLKQTTEAVALVSAALGHARPEEPGVARRFRAQRMQEVKEGRREGGNGTEPTTVAAGAGDLGMPILASIKIDPTPFEAAIAANDAWEFKDMIGKANLLLLADRAREAREVMRMAYELAGTEKEVAAATEGVARAMRAEDGSVGRANAWLLSLKRE